MKRLQTQARLDKIRESGVLKVGTAGDYMPVSYLDPETGSYVGFDAELVEDLLDYVNDFLAKEKGSGRIDELAEEYFFKYLEYEDELRPAA